MHNQTYFCEGGGGGVSFAPQIEGLMQKDVYWLGSSNTN